MVKTIASLTHEKFLEIAFALLALSVLAAWLLRFSVSNLDLMCFRGLYLWICFWTSVCDLWVTVVNHWAPFEINGAVHIEARVYSLDSGWSRYHCLKRSARGGYSIWRRLSENVVLDWKSAKPRDSWVYPFSECSSRFLALFVVICFLLFEMTSHPQISKCSAPCAVCEWDPRLTYVVLRVSFIYCCFR